MSVLEEISLLEPLVLGAVLGLVPTAAVRGVLADTLRNGRQAARERVPWIAAGLLCISSVCLALCTAFIHNLLFFAGLAMFGALLLCSLAYDLWQHRQFPEDEPLFTKLRLFFTPWVTGLYWMLALTVACAGAQTWESFLPAGSRWLYLLVLALSFAASLLFLIKKYDEHRAFFRGSMEVRWIFRLASVLLVLLALLAFSRSVQTLMQAGAL